MALLNKIPSWIKNKYALAVLGFVVWMIFFDDRDIITTHFRQPNELKQLQKSELYYQEQIDLTKAELEELKANSATIEKYAREKYFMKRDSEDLFIINK
jgi:cell division protein FtsB